MMKFLVVFLILIISLNARENPFFPSKNETDIPISTNQITVVEPLKRAAITLPSTARTIQSVTVTYKNLDGSISNIKEELGYRVDWHLPIFISQNIGGNEQKNLRVKTSEKKEKFSKILSLSFISLSQSYSKVKITTKDTMIRNFLLTTPHRIVCDFKRDIDIRSYEKKLNTKANVKRVRIGNHKGYYRVVIELDGHYRYSVSNTSRGYLINLL